MSTYWRSKQPNERHKKNRDARLLLRERVFRPFGLLIGFSCYCKKCCSPLHKRQRPFQPGARLSLKYCNLYLAISALIGSFTGQPAELSRRDYDITSHKVHYNLESEHE